ncbi:MAG: EscU/YscU/HrcU family type III secretion system export apparatus switch protein [Bdellovibrionales bacterium]|nr:EscU/YscU/HrcU family type III secretion system export apparatus switch protein [Bdellovibrionales bacterium]
MADSEQEERSEEATQQRREDFRKRGQVAQTRELGSVLMLLCSILAMWLLGKFFLFKFMRFCSNTRSPSCQCCSPGELDGSRQICRF